MQYNDQGLYSFENEHDACGVGLVADINNIPSHAIIEQGLTVLKNLMHRGATGGDVDTGDGAGLLCALPDAFFRKIVTCLPAKGQYGVCMMFGGLGREAEIEKIVTAKSAKILAWRDVPHNLSAAGTAAAANCPVIRQIFIDGAGFGTEKEFERQLFVIRRLLEKQLPEIYICSMSCRSVIYKGLLLASQIQDFYPDLSDLDFASPLAVVHQRYSTNTFPTWELAQPFRYLAHNGEINTIRGNLAHLKIRENRLQSELLDDDLSDLLPLVNRVQSDSASLDNMLELLTASGRDLCHAMLMLMPQAFGENYHMSRDLRGFFTYHAALMEPWDGPAAVIFSDGVNAGAMLDRNGLRPLRYTLTADNLFVLASEAGVLDIAPAAVKVSGRLRPGEMIYCDLENRRLVKDDVIKKRAARRRPYRRWVEENHISVNGLFGAVAPAEISPNLAYNHKLFGYTREDLELIIKPMALSGREAVGSMGNDGEPAAFSKEPQLFFNYFRQQFAQVTNPPIDSLREDLAMSLTTFLGNKGNILSETPQHARVIRLARPIITNMELDSLRDMRLPDFKCAVLAMGFFDDMAYALENLAKIAVEKARTGHSILILSDKQLPGGYTPIPSLLATTIVNRALADARLRSETSIIIQTGEARETMHFNLLLAFGATAVNPYLAFETVSHLVALGSVAVDLVTAASNYIKAVDQGILKSMAKMGISTLRSYRGARLFTTLGLGPELLDAYFTGIKSPIGGVEMDRIARDAKTRMALAEEAACDLPAGGCYAWRKNGANHMWSPEVVRALHKAAATGDRESYLAFSELAEAQTSATGAIRSCLDFIPTPPIPLIEVESAANIAKRFVAEAMSLGSISPEAHETIAQAMNSIKAASNSGEGGEDPARFDTNRNCAVKQVASGRFGVTINYLAHAREIQIKMAQGAKPGEGGQLPGHKVTEYIAGLRHAMPHVSLISPPPHHDIYSIEDLSQLVYDLRCANPRARISVKLAAENGIGPVAAGVAKARADVVLISGHDGGTGAAALSSIKYAGIPWELGLAEAQQTLIINKLRDKVCLQVDGGFKTGRDVMVAALLGAEEFGFATALLICLGCVMCRKCHNNACKAAIATQNAELRVGFKGKPEQIANYLLNVAEDVRCHLARLGLRSLDEATGRCDLLRSNPSNNMVPGAKFDFDKLLYRPEGPVRFGGRCHQEEPNYDQAYILPQLDGFLQKNKTGEFTGDLRNTHRAVGTALSGEIARRFGEKGLSSGSLTLNLSGCAGQSLGAFLAKGVQVKLCGEANDFVGKGLSGGKICIYPPKEAGFRAPGNVIAGNVAGYGATKGQIYIAGRAGERFAIRNSGAVMVVEGVGDHGCEYMTGGRVVVLGKTGVNFAAGMTGGLAYVLDLENDFDLKCNMASIDLENIAENSADDTELLFLLQAHLQHTGSSLAKQILDDWIFYREKFVKVFPVEYRLALGQMSHDDLNAVDRLQPIH